jgi:hypothetical protein
MANTVSATRMCQTQRLRQQADSHNLRPESKARTTPQSRFCPEGVGARLVGDLPGSGSKIIHLRASGTPHAQVLLPLRARSPTRWSATPVAPTPSGQTPFGVSCNTAACGLPGF